MKTINRYIPELVAGYIATSNFKNKEHLYIICDMLERIKIYRKPEKNQHNDFIDIPVHFFKDIISSEISYKEAMFYLQSNKIIECDGKYSKDSGKALGYRFYPEYISKITTVTIEKPTLFKRITGKVNEANNAVENLLKPNRDHFLSTFKIDHKKACEYRYYSPDKEEL